MLVWPLHLPSCCSSVREAKNTLLSKNPFSIWGRAVVTTEMAPRSPRRSHYITVTGWSSEITFWWGRAHGCSQAHLHGQHGCQSCSKRAWWPSPRTISLAAWQHWEKGGDSFFLEQTSTETTAICSKVFHKASFEYQFIHTWSCLWTINPDGQDNYWELISFPILPSNTVILQSQEHWRYTVLLTVPTGSQQIQQAMVFLMIQSWARFEFFKVPEENVTGMFLKDLSYFSTRDWKLQFYCSTDSWAAGNS